MHTNALDETLALPTEEAATVALRTQQILAEETGLTNTVDPLGGSYTLEALTDRMEEEAGVYIARIDKMGGIVEAIEKGFPQQEIAEAAFEFQAASDKGDYVTVGVNGYQSETGEATVEVLRIGLEIEQRRRDEVGGRKRARAPEALGAAIEGVRRAARNRGRSRLGERG